MDWVICVCVCFFLFRFLVTLMLIWFWILIFSPKTIISRIPKAKVINRSELELVQSEKMVLLFFSFQTHQFFEKLNTFEVEASIRTIKYVFSLRNYHFKLRLLCLWVLRCRHLTRLNGQWMSVNFIHWIFVYLVNCLMTVTMVVGLKRWNSWYWYNLKPTFLQQPNRMVGRLL